jgi:hypothetical protein
MSKAPQQHLEKAKNIVAFIEELLLENQRLEQENAILKKGNIFWDAKLRMHEETTQALRSRKIKKRKS